MRQFARRKAIDRRLKRRRGDEVWLIAVAASVQNLQRNFATFLMHGIGNCAVVRQLADVIQHRAARHPHTGGIRRYPAADDQRHAMTCAFGVEDRQSLSAVRVLLQPGMHRTHQHTVFQLGKTQIERGEQRRIAHKDVQYVKLLLCGRMSY